MLIDARWTAPIVLAVCLTASVAATGPAAAGTSAPPADQTARAARLLAWVTALASDEFEGRAPGTPGETKTVAYLIEQFRAQADWDLRGALEDIDLLAAVGLEVADGHAYPEWKPGTEVKAVRERALAARQPGPPAAARAPATTPAPATIAAAARAYRQAHEPAIVRELADTPP